MMNLSRVMTNDVLPLLVATIKIESMCKHHNSIRKSRTWALWLPMKDVKMAIICYLASETLSIPMVAFCSKKRKIPCSMTRVTNEGIDKKEQPDLRPNKLNLSTRRHGLVSSPD